MARAYKIFSPNDNDIGTWLVQIAPANGEIVGEKHDGSEVFDPIDADLLQLGKVLDEIETFIYDPGSANYGPHIWLSGAKQRKEVTIQIYVDPIDESDPTWSFDVNRGGGNRFDFHCLATGLPPAIHSLISSKLQRTAAPMRIAFGIASAFSIWHT